MKNTDNFNDILPNELSQADIDMAHQYFDDSNPEEFHLWGIKCKTNLEYNGRKYKMLIDKRDSDELIMISLGYATGASTRSLAQACFIRDYINPEATLILNLNSTGKDTFMNYSKAERQQIRRGALEPAIGRLATALEFAGKPKNLTMLGISLGAKTMLEFASSEACPPAAVAIFGSPSVIDRSLPGLVYDFAWSGYHYDKAIKSNFKDHDSPLAIDVRPKSTPLGAFNYARSLIHPDNLAMASAICNESTVGSIEKIANKGGSVVHSWGDLDTVSPDQANMDISNKFKKELRYSGRRLNGVGHSAGHFYLLMGLLTRYARDLKRRNDKINFHPVNKITELIYHKKAK